MSSAAGSIGSAKVASCFGEVGLRLEPAVGVLVAPCPARPPPAASRMSTQPQRRSPAAAPSTARLSTSLHPRAGARLVVAGRVVVVRLHRWSSSRRRRRSSPPRHRRRRCIRGNEARSAAGAANAGPGRRFTAATVGPAARSRCDQAIPNGGKRYAAIEASADRGRSLERAVRGVGVGRSGPAAAAARRSALASGATGHRGRAAG